MKKSTLIIFIALVSTNLFSQGTIQNFTVSPASPTTSDYVKVYVDLMFTSGGCSVTNQGLFTNGNTSDAYALHCLGMLAFICSTTDTFNLGYLSAGNHSFLFTLNTGFGGPNCTAGIVPDDIDSTHFVVSLATNIETNPEKSPNILVYPNPFNSMTMIKINSELKFKNAELKVSDINGKTLKIISEIQSNDILFKRDDLENGIYFYQLFEDNRVIASGKFVLDN